MSAWSATAMYPDTSQPGERFIDKDASSSERTYAMFLHLSPLAATLVMFGMPILIPVALPLVLWQVRRKESPFLDDHGKESVNFQISCVILFFALLLSVIGAILIPALIVMGIVSTIKASCAAQRGEFYRYPCCIRLIH